MSSFLRMPAEWEPHEATWLSWPHEPSTWPGLIDKIPPIWVEMITALSPFEKIRITVNDRAMKDEVVALLTKQNIPLHQIEFFLFPTNDCWMRDHGPIFVKDPKNKIIPTNWIFNKWGGKYPPWDLDNEIPKQISKALNLPLIDTNIVLEGGSIEVNGLGSVLTTESCLLNPNRNPKCSKQDLSSALKKYLGATNILWLGEGITGDDTDGHVDDLARFVAPQTVVTVVEEDPQDENYKPLQDNLKRLRLMKDQIGNPFKIVTLPMPSPLFHEGQRLPASYANFYIGNGVVLVPIFAQPTDQKALDVLKKLFPRRGVLGLDAKDLVAGLGAFHCITQQQPI